MTKNKQLVLAALIAAQTAFLCCSSANSDYFVLREYDGKIALFRTSDPQPITVYETRPEALFPADAALLRDGISLKNEGELNRLIEDLGLE